MKIGIPKELKDNEFRVAITPAGVRELTSAGHELFIEAFAGKGSSIEDDEYAAAGAKILSSADEVWGVSELVCKVKEPIAEEYRQLREGLTLFTYLHLAASYDCTLALLKAKTTGIAYETVQTRNGGLPLLAPMSEVAGRMAPLVGAIHLFRPNGGRGVLVSGVAGVDPANIVIIGGGVAGCNAAAVASGMRAHVSVLDTDVTKLRYLDDLYLGRVTTIKSTAESIEKACLDADLVIGAVLVTGAKAPRLVTDDLVSRMKPGSVLVDIAVDQGGCFESTRPTTHSQPTFGVHASTFYCVANMPGAVPNTSTYALTNATLSYTLEIAAMGWRAASRRNEALASGVNTMDGSVTYKPVADAHGLGYVALDQVW